MNKEDVVIKAAWLIIKRQRKMLRLTQADVSKASGISISALSRLENGEVDSLRCLLIVCNALKIAAHEVVEEASRATIELHEKVCL